MLGCVPSLLIVELARRCQVFLIVARLELVARVDQLELTLLTHKFAFRSIAFSLSFFLLSLLVLTTHDHLAFDLAFLELSCLLSLVFLFALSRQIEQLDRLRDQALLNLEVERAVRREARRMVHFQDPRLQLIVQEDIKAQDLKAHGVLNVVWLTRSVGVGEHGLHRTQALDYHVLNVLKNFFAVEALLIDVAHREGHAPLVAHFVLVTA